MSGVTEPGIHFRGREPLALVEQFLLLRASRSGASAKGGKQSGAGEVDGSGGEGASSFEASYSTTTLASFPSNGSNAGDASDLSPSTSSPTTLPSSRLTETLPKLYEYEWCGLGKLKGKLFLPLTVTDELGQRWIAYSLLIPVERKGGGEEEEEDSSDDILILAALSRLHRCFSGMCTLLETILDFTVARGALGEDKDKDKDIVKSDLSSGMEEVAKLVSWVTHYAPFPLPGLSYKLVVSSPFCPGGKREMLFSNFAPSNMLPWANEIHFYKLIQTLGIHGLFKLWIAALLEQRILLVTSKKGPLAATYLTICAETLLMMLEPMKWQGIYVPFVPNSMSVLVEAPTPYVMGISETGFRSAELDDGIVEVNVDNGRICLPSNLPVIPESLESKLDMIDSTLEDPLEKGFGCGPDGLSYSLRDIQGLLFKIRKSFGAILVDIVENTKKLSQNGTRSLEEIRVARSRRASAVESKPLAGDPPLKSNSSKELSPGVELTKMNSFSQTPEASASASKKKLFAHRRAVSYDSMKFNSMLSQSANEGSSASKLDFIPDTESYEESLYFYEEIYQTQIFQEFLVSGWPPNWPRCIQWDEEEMESRHSANKPFVTFQLQIARKEKEDAGNGACSRNGGILGCDIFPRLSSVLTRAASLNSLTLIRNLETRILIGEEETLHGPFGASLEEDGPFELPEAECGEPIAIFASFIERYSMLQPRNDLVSPLKQAAVEANGFNSVLKNHSLHQKYDYLDYFEKALETGVQTYSCIPMARFYRSLKDVEETTRDKIESSLGPNICMLLEQVRLSDKESSMDEEDLDKEKDDRDERPEGGVETGEDGEGEGEELKEELCATLTATAAQDLSSLRKSKNQKPLNMTGRPHPQHQMEAADQNSKSLKKPDEIMLVCVSTVKMLLTIQANKNNNNVRQYIDANDVIEIAESSEYVYFTEATAELASVDPTSLSQKERVIFFINLYNLMVLHAALDRARYRKKSDSRLRWLPRASPFGWMKFLRNATYNVGGNIYSALDVEHSILRSSRPYNDNLFIGRLLPYFKSSDPRQACKVNQQIPLLTFALCPGTMCSPPFKCFHEHDFDNELVSSAKTFLVKYCHAQVSEKVRGGGQILEVRLPLLLKWYRHDLGHNSSGVNNQVSHLNSNKWLISIAYLIKGTKVSTCILEAIDAKIPIVVKYDTYKWELGWMLIES